MEKNASFLASFLAPFLSGTAMARLISLRTPSGSPSFATAIFALEHASKILMRKVRSPLSQPPRSFVSKQMCRIPLADSSAFSTSAVAGRGSVIFHSPESLTRRVSAVGVVTLRPAVGGSVCSGTFTLWFHQFSTRLLGKDSFLPCFFDSNLLFSRTQPGAFAHAQQVSSKKTHGQSASP